jgi:4-hydroxy-3-methylbut-2-enyl diphosphate reductase
MRSLTILLASPRGFCAGVERAILTVDDALRRFGAPIFVRHQIVHNPYVVAELAANGAIFVDKLDAVPDDAPVVFSAHGVAKSVRAEAQRRRLPYIDATCPLVTKVHREVKHHVSAGRTVILIGHEGHPEVLGTMGQAAPDTVILVQSAAEAAALRINETASYGLVTQTTLSAKDAEEIKNILRRRVARLHEPSKADICYATTNRQTAVEAIAPRCDAVIVIGGSNSSNSRRLVEIARDAGCPKAVLIESVADLHPLFFKGVSTVGLTSGASTPEVLVQELVKHLSDRFRVSVEEISTATERTHFRLPTFSAVGTTYPRR